MVRVKTQRERGRGRETAGNRQRDTHTETETERQRHTEKNRQRQTDTERDRDRETERETDRQRHTERWAGWGGGRGTELFEFKLETKCFEYHSLSTYFSTQCHFRTRVKFGFTQELTLLNTIL